MIIFSRKENEVEAWFVGTVIFYFSHYHLDQEHHFAFVEVAKSHKSSRSNKFLPSISLRQSHQSPSFAVIDISQITDQVGLLKSPNTNSYYVISPTQSFDKDVSETGGMLTLL